MELSAELAFNGVITTSKRIAANDKKRVAFSRESPALETFKSSLFINREASQFMIYRPPCASLARVVRAVWVSV